MKELFKHFIPAKFEGYFDFIYSYIRNRGKILETKKTVCINGTSVEYSFESFVEKKCIFFHIPKSAGISVSLSLFGNLGGGHLNAQFYKCLFGKQFDNYYKFTFVRNPFTRLVSAYEYLKKGGNIAFTADMIFKKNTMDLYKDFDDFVQNWLQHNYYKSVPHFRTQFSFISLSNKVITDFIGRYENLNDDFLVVAKHLNINNVLENINVTEYDKRKYENYYSNPKTLEIVKEIYKIDFITFDYPMEIQINN